MLVRNGDIRHAMHGCFQQTAQKQQDGLHSRKVSYETFTIASVSRSIPGPGTQTLHGTLGFWDSILYCNRTMITILSGVLIPFVFITLSNYRSNFESRFQIQRFVNGQMLPGVLLGNYGYGKHVPFPHTMHRNQPLTFLSRISLIERLHLISRILR